MKHYRAKSSSRITLSEGTWLEVIASGALKVVAIAVLTTVLSVTASVGAAHAEPALTAQRGGALGDVVIYGDHAYVRQGSSIVTFRLDGKGETLDVSAVYGPLGTLTLGLAVHKDRLYASWRGATWDDAPPDVTLSVFSLADPSRPEHLGELDLPGDEPLKPGDLLVLGDVLYVLADGELLPIDLSDPDRPVAGSPTPFSGSNLTQYDETHLLASGFNFSLGSYFYGTIFDVSAPLVPVAAGSLFSFDAISGVAAGNGLLVVGTYSGFAVFDLSDPSAPEQVALVDGPEGGGVLVGRTHLVGDGDQIRLFDLSDPENPAEGDPLPLGLGEMRRSDLNGDRLLFVTSDARAARLDVSAPPEPVLGPVADLPQGAGLRGVSTVGNQIYVSDAYRGLRLADAKMDVVADLEADWPNVGIPAVDGSRALLTDGAGFHIQGGLAALVCGPSEEHHLLDVSDSTDPVLLGIYSDAQVERLQSVHFDPNDPGRVYLGYRDGIDLVDVSDPSEPALASRLRVGGRVWQLEAAPDGGLWATGPASGLTRIDEVASPLQGAGPTASLRSSDSYGLQTKEK